VWVSWVVVSVLFRSGLGIIAAGWQVWVSLVVSGVLGDDVS
jgi:hypothetical protein